MPGAGLLSLYALVWVEPRYLAAPFTVLWLGALLLLRVPVERDRLVHAACAFAPMLMVCGCTLLVAFVRPDTTHLEAAAALRRAGVGAGTPIATIGNSGRAYWARLARVRIVVEIPESRWDWEIPSEEVSPEKVFWALDEGAQERVLDRIAGTGVNAVVAENVATGRKGWQRLGNTRYSLLLLR